MDPERILEIRGHRPWPVPSSPWIMRQTWQDLLFAHWVADEAELRALVPKQLELDLHQGQAWVGVVPFKMHDLGVRSLPGLPTATDFLELNVRTYVKCNGRPGVFFFTLEASSQIAVGAARSLFFLPYHHARMTMARLDTWVVYASERDGSNAAFRARYRPTGPVFEPANGTLDHFLTERYALYTTAPGGVLSTAEIHHPPWQLQPAEAEIDTNTIAGAVGISLPDTAPLLHYVKRQDMVNWALKPGCPAAP